MGTVEQPRSQLDDQVCFALYTAFRSVAALYRPLLDKLGLTYPQYLVMLVLWERKSCTIKELCTALQLDSGTLSPLLKRMQAHDLVQRRRSVDDERRVEVTLTEKGRALRDEARTVPDRLACALEIPSDELVSLRETLRRVTASALDRVACQADASRKEVACQADASRKEVACQADASRKETVGMEN